jgi:ribosomal protein S18 acetylase RimI-like enzyme
MALVPDPRPLDTCVWQSLTGAHRAFSVGTDTVRRYAPGFSPIIGFANPEEPDWEALATLCAPGEHLYTGAWAGPVPPGWTLDLDSAAWQMVWQGGLPEPDPEAPWVTLTASHAPQMVDMAARLRPGPFGLRTLELGDYLGYVEQGQLIAMAGERFQAGPFREVSGVCTEPSHQGRGLARRLMLALIRRQCQRGQVPFLHVMRDNARARQIYERMGFVAYREMIVRVISRAQPIHDSTSPSTP